MSGAALTLARTYGQITAFALVTGLFFVALSATPAAADSPHVSYTATTSACAACHATHTAVNNVLLRDGIIDDPVSSSCMGCHDGTDETATNVASGSENSFGLSSGHSLTQGSSDEGDIDSCATCHDPHGSSSEERMIPVKTLNGAEVTSAGSEMCLSCHDTSESWFEKDYPAEPTRDTTGYPVAGRWPGSDTYTSSSNAHRLISETTQTVGLSDPVRREEGSCLYCHASHRGSNAYDGLVNTYTVPTESTLESDQNDGTYAALCFTCHGGETPSGFESAPRNIRQFATAEGTSTVGHQIVTSGGTLPVGAPLPCFECHNPHGSERGNASLISDERGASLDTTDDDDVRSFCFTCHTTSDTTAGWEGDPGAYAVVSSAAEVVGLRRDGGSTGDENLLHLSANDGHSQDDTQSCYDCHGDSYDAGGHNAHNPNPVEGGSFSLMGASVAETNTAPLASVDLSPSIEPTGSLDIASSMDATASLEATESVVGTDTGGWLPELPSLPDALGILFGTTGTAVVGARRRDGRVRLNLTAE